MQICVHTIFLRLYLPNVFSKFSIIIQIEAVGFTRRVQKVGIVLLKTWLQVEDGIKPFALSKAIDFQNAAHLVLRLYCAIGVGC